MTAISRERPPVSTSGPAATDTGPGAGSRPLPALRAERAAVPAVARSSAPPHDDIRKLPLTRPLLHRLVAGGFLAAMLVFVTGTAIGISLGLHLYRDMAVAEPALTMALPPSVDLPEPEPLPAPVASPAPPPPAPPPVPAEEEPAPPADAAALTAQTAPETIPEPEAPAVPAAPAAQEAEPASPAAAGQGFIIQVAMFTRAANAEQMVRDLQSKSLPAYSRMRQNNQQQERFFVYAGPFPSRDDAQAAIPGLKKSGISDPLRVRQAEETAQP